MPAATEPPAEGADPRAVIGPVTTVDIAGTAAAAVLVVGLDLFVVSEPLAWIVVPALVARLALVGAARLRLGTGTPAASLALVALGSWIAAATVTVAIPSLWPVMAIAVILPLVLATPFLDRGQLTVAIAATAAVAAGVAVAGLAYDDAGVIADIDDDVELVLVTAALLAHLVPLALIVWQHHRLQQAALDRARLLNDALEASRAALADSRRRVVDAGDRERSRIERDLHDGAQQRLVALRLRLQMISEMAEAPLRDRIEAMGDELGAALDELRELAHGIYPPVLETGGLGDALAAVARRSPLAVELDVDGIGRYARATETAVYFTALEALANAAKHAPGATVTVTLRAADEPVAALVLEVVDDGPGFATETWAASRGLLNMQDRITAVGGTATVVSSPGAGTRVTATVPVATRAPVS